MSDWDRLIESKIVHITPDHATKRMTIELLKPDENFRYLAVADGVNDILINGLRLNNIIDYVICHSNMEDVSSLSKLKFLITEEEGAYSIGELPHVDSKVEEIKKGHLQLWEFCPVYGASILILAKDMCLKTCD